MIEPMVQEEKVRQTFSRRLALACDRAGMESHGRQADIAAALSVTPKAVSKWFNAESIPRRGKISELADYVGAQSNWLLGEGDEDQTTPIEAKYNRRGAFYRVDILDVQASAGNGSLVSTDFIETIRAIEYTNEQARSLFGNRPSESVKVITVRGDSMEGTIEPGDQIFLDMNVSEFDGDGIYVFVFGKTLHVKRLQMQKNRIAVLSDNKLYEPWYIEEGDEDQFRIMAKVLLRQSIEYKRFV
ncbi:S24 family peptidase [Brenneria populi]|uniref:S24 family peptidase n=1 Tax=Brenneria populi TaxID=1505588 RepID=A0ABU6JSS3_9GAMM|nr:S24 family peptidase [Brenneria populi Li et al. 2015]